MSRVGAKKSDLRWMDDNGEIWASEYEYRVYKGLSQALGRGRVSRNRTEDGGSFDYTTPVTHGVCNVCGSGEVVQARVYTPDVYVSVLPRRHDEGRTFIEAKGFFPAKKRELLRNFLKTGPSINLVLILQGDGKATARRSLTQWVDSFLKIPVFVWNPCARPTAKRSMEEVRKCPDEIVAHFGI